VVAVTAGELTVTSRRCERETYEAGETFVEQGPRRHLPTMPTPRHQGDPMSRSALVMCGAALLPLMLAASCSDSESSKDDGQAVTATTTLAEGFRARADSVVTVHR
jgi:hypothetical protein